LAPVLRVRPASKPKAELVMSDQIKKFERWRRLLPKRTMFFVELIEAEVAPLFLTHGYRRYSDYPGKASWIGLQRRNGDLWPTVELHFGHRGRPFVTLSFALLPETCRTILLDRPGFYDIPRIKAGVVDAPAFFSLRKGRYRNDDNVFGDASIFCRPLWLQEKLRREVAELKSLSIWLINFLDTGIPREWLERSTGGQVHPNIFMSYSSRIFHDPESRRLFP
jgi:hypothetical protein